MQFIINNGELNSNSKWKKQRQELLSFLLSVNFRKSYAISLVYKRDLQHSYKCCSTYVTINVMSIKEINITRSFGT